ncbi:MAG: pyrroline-5-carboxylate reductase [Bacteroides sp.]|nr:pyrroline-5-carboxylate reductase [Bacteroides sp.]
MKITIIGAGNMGGAIARGLAQGTLVNNSDITVCDLSSTKLEELNKEYPEIHTSSDNVSAAKGTDLVILAVKPWLIKDVISSLPLNDTQMVASLAAGISFAELSQYTAVQTPLFRVVPNTAISQLASLTAIAAQDASPGQQQQLLDIFNEMGIAMIVPESQIPAVTALTSCGIAFVLTYIQAAMQAGVEMGVYPQDAMRMVAQSVKGAAELILNNDTHPSVEIDKVTTPGGITIKGINELEHAGFTSAVIRAMKASK